MIIKFEKDLTSKQIEKLTPSQIRSITEPKFDVSMTIEECKNELMSMAINEEWKAKTNKIQN